MRRLKPLKDKRIGTGRYRLWINQADFDLEAARLSLRNGFNEWTAYQAEQAVEKSLKSVILNAGFIPPKIHKLSILIGYCNDINQRFKHTKFSFRDIDAYTFISRYPFLLPEAKLTPHEQIRKQDAENILNQAEEIVHQIHDILDNVDHIDHAESKAYETDRKEMDLESRLDQAAEALKKSFDVKKIILFGSYARDPKIKEDKTIDLMIIAKTDLQFIPRIIQAREVTGGYMPIIEPLVYTPKEFSTLLEEEGEGFIENAIREGRVLYEEKS
jgi:HEPN domain-containing protein/predicted nucleotidyltransferase